MTECKYASDCSVFFEGKLSGTVAIYKENYCTSKFSECARYQVIAAKGKKQVPPDLFPSDHDRAKELTSG